ncbi:hypothetical protein RJ640_015981 [Escallonia rubra]|uniref:Uncharacterized protein n=1 Tax=Escallonia rubra TaxID=112253 RepID=A0AA88QS70_9ASTE|nr:hypothetical protein RJ640_015981 [Escallonia rubra]
MKLVLTDEAQALLLLSSSPDSSEELVYNYRIQFALMGLLDMYNFLGAIEAIEVSSSLAITIKGSEAGRFGAYSNLKPRVKSHSDDGKQDEKKCFVSKKNMDHSKKKAKTR